MEDQSTASRGCWTCKRRKIGCDKTLPSCRNCIRTRRICAGYGPRLVWRAGSQIHSQCHHASTPPPASSRNPVRTRGSNKSKFIRFNLQDMDLSWGRLDWHNVLGKFHCTATIVIHSTSINRWPTERRLKSIVSRVIDDGSRRWLMLTSPIHTRHSSNVLNDSSRQWIHATSATDGIELLHVTDQRHESILSTAELYRLAALLYLQRVVPLEGDKDRRETYLERALAILSDAKRVSSPWPYFIIACKVKMEDQRSQILDILDTMETTRKIGNVHITRVIIETIWKQKDLRGPSEPFGWWSCPDFGLSVPWFA